MVRHALLVVATLAGFAALALLGFWLFRAAPPPPPGGPQAATETAPPTPALPAPPAPAPPGLPPAYRANTIVPFSDPDVAFMSINVDLDGATPTEALQTIAGAANVPAEPPRGGPIDRTMPLPEIALHLKDQPYLEALLELEAQASLNVSYDAARGFRAQYSMRRGLPGIWSVSGPFAFMLVNMEHSVSLANEGQPNAGEENVMMQFDSLQEPGLKVLRYPMQLTVNEATDNHGNSLISQVPPPWRDNSNATRFPPRAVLAYPRDNPGRRIKHFRATGTYMVQLKGEAITIQDPAHAPASSKTLNGIRADLGAVRWVPGAPPSGPATYTMDVTYHKTPDFKGDWPTLAQGLIATKPTVVMPGTTNPFINISGNVNGDTATVICTVNLPASFKGNPAVVTPVTEPPQFDSLTLEIPSGVKQVEVPVELNDIPLP